MLQRNNLIENVKLSRTQFHVGDIEYLNIYFVCFIFCSSERYAAEGTKKMYAVAYSLLHGVSVLHAYSSDLLLRTLVVGRRQQSESIEAALDME